MGWGRPGRAACGVILGLLIGAVLCVQPALSVSSDLEGLKASSRVHLPERANLAGRAGRLPETPPLVSPGARCSTATAKIGGRPGEIDVVTSCLVSRRSGVPSVSIDRQAGGSSMSAGILAFSRRPRVSGPGATSLRGVCAREGGAIEGGDYQDLAVNCWVRASGKITISGRIWVEPARRCSARVSITAPVVSKDEFRSLFRRYPMGCAALG